METPCFIPPSYYLPDDTYLLNLTSHFSASLYLLLFFSLFSSIFITNAWKYFASSSLGKNFEDTQQYLMLTRCRTIIIR